jgi:Prophage minor tail protein Z (GPZ)
MAVAFTISTHGFKEAERALAGIPKGFPKAAADAINRGLIAGRELASSKIYGTYNIGKGSAKGGLTMKKASWGNLSGSLEARGSMLPIQTFKPTVSRRRTGGGGGRRAFGAYQQRVTVAVLRGGKKLIGPKGGTSGAFQIPDGRIMERRQSSKYPIFPVSAIGIPHMLGALKVGDEVHQRMSEIINKRLAANVALFLGKGAATWR